MLRVLSDKPLKAIHGPHHFEVVLRQPSACKLRQPLQALGIRRRISRRQKHLGSCKSVLAPLISPQHCYLLPAFDASGWALPCVPSSLRPNPEAITIVILRQAALLPQGCRSLWLAWNSLRTWAVAGARERRFGPEAFAPSATPRHEKNWSVALSVVQEVLVRNSARVPAGSGPPQVQTRQKTRSMLFEHGRSYVKRRRSPRFSSMRRLNSRRSRSTPSSLSAL